MNIILFGPPGIGKSTIIGILKTLGQRAIDLEDLYPNRIRFQIPNLTPNDEAVFIGAADLSPSRSYSNTKKVLLYADQSTYDKRRALRDREIPGKANQSKHSIDSWKKASYDLQLDTSGMNPKQVAQTLISFVERSDKS